MNSQLKTYPEVIIAEHVRDLYPNGLQGPREGDAGTDLILPADLNIMPNEVIGVDTGLRLWIGDPGVACQVIPRSGLGTKDGLVLANLTALIDSNYQGALKTFVWNRGKTPISLPRGTRFAQMFFVPVFMPVYRTVEEFSGTSNRGSGGFGSTGQ